MEYIYIYIYIYESIIYIYIYIYESIIMFITCDDVIYLPFTREQNINQFGCEQDSDGWFADATSAKARKKSCIFLGRSRSKHSQAFLDAVKV